MGWVVSATPRRVLPPGKGPITHWTGGCVGPRAGLDSEVREKILYLWRESNLDRPVVQSVARQRKIFTGPKKKSYISLLNTVGKRRLQVQNNSWSSKNNTIFDFYNFYYCIFFGIIFTYLLLDVISSCEFVFYFGDKGRVFMPFIGTQYVVVHLNGARGCLWTAATNGPIVHPLSMDSKGGTILTNENRNSQKNLSQYHFEHKPPGSPWWAAGD
jgi:hypothetical protein